MLYLPLYGKYMLESEYNLKGLLVGNGKMDSLSEIKSYIEIAHS